MHDGDVKDVAWSADGRRLATVTETELSLFDVHGERTDLYSLKAFDVVPRAVCWAPNGKRLACVCDGQVIILTLGADSLDCLTIDAPGMKRYVYNDHAKYDEAYQPAHAEWSSDGKLLMGVNHDRLSVYDVGGSDDDILAAPVQTCIVIGDHPGMPHKVSAAQWSPDSLRIAVCGRGYGGIDIKIYDAEHHNLMVLDNWMEGVENINALAWYRDGSALVVAREDGGYEEGCPIDVYKVMSREEQQAGLKARKPAYDDEYRPAERLDSFWARPKDMAYLGDRAARSGVKDPDTGKWGPPRPYQNSEATIKSQESGYCSAIGQGWLLGIDPLGTEHVAYLKPMYYISAEEDSELDADERGEFCYEKFNCFAAIELPYENVRAKIMHTLAGGLELLASERATIAAGDDDSKKAFFQIMLRLRVRWEGGIPLVMSFVLPGSKACWPLGEPSW